MRGTILVVPPFAEELNKSRRMMAQQSRLLAEAGFGVLQVDLYGCGDSSGEIAQARWEIWRQDIAMGWEWLRRQSTMPAFVWGVRMGGLLAVDCILRRLIDPDRVLLWQPVLSGEAYLHQFIRTESARQMLKGQSRVAGTNELRQLLDAGVPLEIAGYELAPELAKAIARLSLTDIELGTVPVDWFQLVTSGVGGLPPAAVRAIEAWRHCGVTVDLHAVEGPMFWATQEITESNALMSQTVEVCNAAARQAG